MNFTKGVGNKKCLKLYLFSKKSKVVDTFSSLKTVSMNLFTDHCTQNFFFTKQCVFSIWTVFSIWVHCGKPMFSPFVNNFLSKTCFSVQITHSENFTWFAFLRHLKFDDRPQGKPWALWLATILNSLKTIFFQDEIFAINQFQTKSWHLQQKTCYRYLYILDVTCLC